MENRSWTYVMGFRFRLFPLWTSVFDFAPIFHMQATISFLPHTPINHKHTKTTTMPRLRSRSRHRKVGRLFKRWMNLRRWRMFKFALGEGDPFDICDVVMEEEAKCQFLKQYCSHSVGSELATACRVCSVGKATARRLGQ
jgi:hypothetical protein